jgi:hypothetical protein
MAHDRATPDPNPRPTDPDAPEDGPLEDTVDADPVDHEREHGVPPETNDDYEDDELDREGADSFPASDPPGGW